MRLLINTMQRVPYAALILLGVVVSGFVLVLELRQDAIPQLSSFEFQVVTGSALLTLLGYQWILFAKRVTRDGSNGRQTAKRHRWVGVAATCLFALHAVRFGHVWMTGVSVVFFLIALTGVLNREVLGYRQNWIYLIWLVTHIGLSAALVPLVGVHIWVALAYQ